MGVVGSRSGGPRYMIADLVIRLLLLTLPIYTGAFKPAYLLTPGAVQGRGHDTKEESSRA